MRLNARKFSVLVLFVFGFNLIAESASIQFESLETYSSIPSVSSFDNDSGGYQNKDSGSQEVKSKHKECSNPCHRSQCHFGHCAYHPVSRYSLILPDLLNQGLINANSLAHKAPFLDGPKRPPRLS